MDKNTTPTTRFGVEITDLTLDESGRFSVSDGYYEIEMSEDEVGDLVGFTGETIDLFITKATDADREICGETGNYYWVVDDRYGPVLGQGITYTIEEAMNKIYEVLR